MPALVLFFAILLAAGPVVAAPTVWTAGSMELIGPTQTVGSPSTATLSAARGEVESFQIIVRGPAGAVSVEAPTMAGVGFTLYREHYSETTAGWLPDGLLPLPSTFSVNSRFNQPVWVDVEVGRHAAAGDHTGDFIVTSDRGQATVTLELSVWDFELPLRPKMDSAFLLWELRGDLQAAQELLRHRVQASYIDVEDAAVLMAEGQGLANIGFWSGADDRTCSILNPAPTAGQVGDRVALYPGELDLYAYVADEPNASCGWDSRLDQWSAAITANPETKALVTQEPSAGWEWVGISVLLPKLYDEAEVNIALARGQTVWSYNCLRQDDYSPKWLIGEPPTAFRAFPWINYSLGLTGLLYWRCDLWGADPWHAPTAYSAGYPGEGLLLYPGERHGATGACASIRLKWLRDGLEDYDYLRMLAEQGYGDAALEMALTVGSSWGMWTRDPGLIEQVRYAAGQQLDALANPPIIAEVTVTAADGTVHVYPVPEGEVVTVEVDGK